MLMFAHGFNIHFGHDRAARGRRRHDDRARRVPATWCAARTSRASARPALIAVHQDATGQGAASARSPTRAGIGGARAGVHRDHVQGGDRDRPVRRAGRALRRRVGADQGRVRDAGRGRLPAGDRVLRVPARAEADRGPDVRGRPVVDALLDLRHRRVRRLHARAARRERRRPVPRCAGSSTRSRTARSPRNGSRRPTAGSRSSSDFGSEARTSQLERRGTGAAPDDALVGERRRRWSPNDRTAT